MIAAESASIARAEIERAARARPLLGTRAGRAMGIVERHLQNPRAGLITAAVRGGKWTFYVAGSSSEPYRVDPHRGYRCTCPDYRRREAACKHAIAVWSLIRVGQMSPPKGAEVISLSDRRAAAPQKESA